MPFPAQATSRARRTRGQSLAKLTAVLPVFVLMVTGVVELGRASYADLVVTRAAHAGALYGARNPAAAADSDGMVQAALAAGQGLNGMQATAFRVCTCADGVSAPSCSLSECVGGRLLEYVQVQTSAPFNPLFDYPGVPHEFFLKGNAVIKVER